MDRKPQEMPASKDEFMKLVEGTTHAEALGNEAKLRKTVIDAMKASGDQLTREIGEGIAGGTMSWSTVATASAYAGFLEHSLAAMRRFDFAGLVKDLEAARTEDARPPGEARERRDDGEDLWQGLRGRRRR